MTLFRTLQRFTQHGRFKRRSLARHLFYAWVICAGLVLATPPALAAEQLLLVEQDGCYWCEAWDEEIGVVYAITEEGKRAPLRRVDLHDPMPDDVAVKSQAHFTPTFILLRDGAEVGRIEGYPGEDFFWPMLNRLLETSAQQDQQSNQNTAREAPKG